MSSVISCYDRRFSYTVIMVPALWISTVQEFVSTVKIGCEYILKGIRRILRICFRREGLGEEAHFKDLSSIYLDEVLSKIFRE